MQIIECPNGSAVIVPVTAEQVEQITTLMGVTGPDNAPAYNPGQFSLLIPEGMVAAARDAVKTMKKNGGA